MEQDNQNIRAVLSSKGLRYSKPREIILAYFRERAKHVSAEQLYHDIKKQGHHLSLSTVYLNLGVLKDVKLIREFQGVNGESLYDSNVIPHHHLICKRCEKVIDLPLVNIAEKTPEHFLKKHAESVSGWDVDEPSLDLQGVCPSCQHQTK